MSILFYRTKKPFIWLAILSLILQTFVGALPAFAATSSQGPAGGTIFPNVGWAWTNPQNAAASDDVYSSATISSGGTPIHKTAGFGFNIPAGSTINGIEISVERNSDFCFSTCFIDLQASLMKDGSNPIASSNQVIPNDYWPATDTVKTYGGPSNLWGQSWTVDEINSSNFGFAISAFKMAAGTKTVNIDYVSAKIYYTLPDVTPTITVNPYIMTPTNQDITVTASTDVGTLNTTSHTFTANGSFDFIATNGAAMATQTVTISNIDKNPPSVVGDIYINPSVPSGGNLYISGSSTIFALVTDNNESGIDPSSCQYSLNSNQGPFVAGLFDAVNSLCVYYGVDTSSATGIAIAVADNAGNQFIGPITPFIAISQPITSVNYSPATLTNGNVVASITANEPLTITNNGGSPDYTFTDNGTFTFEYVDGFGNVGTQTATVNWIDRTAPVITQVSFANRVGTVTGNTIDIDLSGVTQTDLDLAGGVTVSKDSTLQINFPVFGLLPNIPLTSGYQSKTLLELFGFPLAITPQDIFGTAVAYNGTIPATGTLTDAAGNVTNLTINISADVTPPVVTLNGSANISIEYGNPYTELGATWTDNIDGSGNVTNISGTVNTLLPGTYQITYTKNRFIIQHQFSHPYG